MRGSAYEMQAVLALPVPIMHSCKDDFWEALTCPELWGVLQDREVDGRRGEVYALQCAVSL